MNLDSTSGFLDKYAKVLRDIYIDPSIFSSMITILAIMMAIRYIGWVKIVNVDNISKKVKKKFYIYILGYCLLEYIISFLIAYLIVKLTYANPDSYIINCIFAPGLGFISAIYINYKYIIPLAEKNGYVNPLSIKNHSKKESTQQSSANQVNVVINNGTAVVNNDTDDNTNEGSKISIKDTNIKHISDEDIHSDNFNEIIKETVNKLIIGQDDVEDELKKISGGLDTLSVQVESIIQSQINEKAILLDKLMYKCLVQQFATPEQDKEIRANYYIYHNILHGNHDIKELYELRYLKLPVHEDRRHQNIPVDIDRRKAN